MKSKKPGTLLAALCLSYRSQARHSSSNRLLTSHNRGAVPMFFQPGRVEAQRARTSGSYGTKRAHPEAKLCQSSASHEEKENASPDENKENSNSIF